MKSQIIQTLRNHAISHIEKHRANVEIYLRHPVGIGEHGCIMDTIEKELDEMAKYADQLEILDTYFVD